MGWWLGVYIFIQVASTACKPKHRPLLLPLFWVLMGVHWVKQSDTCKDTNPELFKFVSWYVYFVMTLQIVSIVLSCMFMGFLFYLMNNGYFRTQQAASGETFDAIPLVPLGPDGSPQINAENDGSSENTCCVCFEEFGGNKPVKKTPCGHMIHAECLKPWLNVARTCPICRTDLDQACRQAAAAESQAPRPSEP